MNKELLNILACPKCRGSLLLQTIKGKDKGLICEGCSLLYPIRDTIPIMLIEEALPYNDNANKDNK